MHDASLGSSPVRRGPPGRARTRGCLATRGRGAGGRCAGSRTRTPTPKGTAGSSSRSCLRHPKYARPGICPLPSRGWLPRREYALSPRAVGSCVGNMPSPLAQLAPEVRRPGGRCACCGQ
eukprot:2824000-Pyramimonas_sp.AAC.2